MHKLTTLALCASLSLLVACGDDQKPTGAACNGAQCEAAPATCGNGVVDTGEQCDGANSNNVTCGQVAGFSGGQLYCYPNCRFNTTGCAAGMAYGGSYEVRSMHDLSELVPDKINNAFYAMLRNPGAQATSPDVSLLDTFATALQSAANNSTVSANAIKQHLTKDYWFSAYFGNLATTDPKAEALTTALDAALNFPKTIGTLSTLELAPSSSTGATLMAKEDWESIIYIWRYGCASTDKTCGEYPVQILGVSQEQEYSGVVSGLDTASPSITLGSSGLPRVFTVPFKSVIDWFYSQVLIPTVTNGAATDFRGLLSWLVDCDALATAIANTDGNTTNTDWTPAGFTMAITHEMLEQACETGCSELGTKWTASIGVATDLGTLEIAGDGAAKINDSNGDKRAEGIIDGTWDVSIRIKPVTGGTGQSIMPNGTFTATRN